MKKYEGLFILNTAGKEEGLKDLIDKITAEVTSTGGKVEAVQKMDKKNFSRIADKKFSSGFYLNVVFQAEPGAVARIRDHFALSDEVFRVLFTTVPEPKKETAAK